MNQENRMFTSKEDAKCKQAELAEELKVKFCPLTKDKCREDCMSFYRGAVLDRMQYVGAELKVFYRVQAPACCNALVKGNIAMEGDL